MKIPKLDEVKTPSEAISLAIDWQKWAGEQNLSWLEIVTWQDFFRELAKQFNLIDESRENGII